MNGIIHYVLSSKKKKPIDIQIKDYRQCFDSMWLEDTLNDMYEAGAGVVDDKLALLFEANKEVNVSVKTHLGLTIRDKIKKIILQGDVFGPIECSVAVDTVGKECLSDDKHLHLYKDKVNVPMLAMVDDILLVSECGFKSSMVNSFISTKTSWKKLQFGVKKCFKMHIGKAYNEAVCPDGWDVKVVEDFNTKEVTKEDEYSGAQKMEEVSHEKYLGDIISSDGRNTKNITARVNRGWRVSPSHQF